MKTGHQIIAARAGAVAGLDAYTAELGDIEDHFPGIPIHTLSATLSPHVRQRVLTLQIRNGTSYNFDREIC